MHTTTFRSVQESEDIRKKPNYSPVMSNAPIQTHWNYLIVGSGLAGLTFALKVAETCDVLVLSKTELDATNSAMAQGGIAAAINEGDSFEQHLEDTLIAGAGLCDKEVVLNFVKQAPDRIRDLITWGVQFDKSIDDGFELTQEGGHSQRRILHIADHTGQEIHRQLLQKAQAHPNIRFMEQAYAVDLITTRRFTSPHVGPTECVGAYVLDKATGEVKTFTADFTLLATGGAGKTYLYTSNWSGATGDGLGLAHRAGARLANLEFMQFHPTCLYHPSARNFLISEALRGEGGELINSKGRAFMKDYDERGSLAPRDIVARSIDAEMKKTGEACVFLDMSSKPSDYIRKRFPLIYQRCLSFGIDISTQPIPVVPAAHYLCGGVLTDINGQTDVKRLFALGETACTGLHGANRLASNSLLECLGLSHNAAQWIKQELEARRETPLNPKITKSLPDFSNQEKEDSDELIVVHHMWDEIRRLMWNYVGIVRSTRRLERAQHRLSLIQKEIKEYYSSFKTHSDIEELRNIALVAELTIECALKRKESRGIHYNIDYIQTSERAENSYC